VTPAGEKDMPRRPEDLWKRVIAQSLAMALLLLTPFVIFVHHHRYSFSHPEVIVCLIVLAALGVALGLAGAWSPTFSILALAGLLTLFVDIQFASPNEKFGFLLTGLLLLAAVWLLRRHAARVIAIVMATVLVSTVLLPGASARSHQGSGAVQHKDLPLVLHVVLDEHIGLEGLPAEVASPAFTGEMRSFFVDHRFLLFGRAYSEHVETRYSLSHLVNFTSGQFEPRLVGRGTHEATYDIARNDYFDRLAQQGYAIQVYQPDHLDFCAKAGSGASCETYRATTLEALQGLSASAFQKASVVGGMFVDRSYLYTNIRERYKRFQQSNAWLPAWDWERRRVGPLSSMIVLDRVIARVSKAQRGDFVFAHLLLPHYPYIYDGQCRTRPPQDWLDRTEVDAGNAGMGNSPETRAARYAKYLEQVACVRMKLGQLIAAIPAPLQQDAIIIIQGDHGSRITLVDPTQPGASPPDFADSYSTLFAIRSASLEPGYDRRLLPITCLLRAFVQSDFTSVSALDEGCRTTPGVLIRKHEKIVESPLPPFGEPADQTR
jgi:hypothetical protein